MSGGSGEAPGEEQTVESNDRLKEKLAEAEARIRRVEANRDERVAAARSQLQEGKEKAKQLFLARVTKFEKQISELTEAARARDAENAALKSLVRESDSRVVDADKRASVAEERLAGVEDVVRAAVDDAVAVVGKERDEARAALVGKIDDVERQSLELRKMEEEGRSFRESQAHGFGLLEKALSSAVGSMQDKAAQSDGSSDPPSLEQPLESAPKSEGNLVKVTTDSSEKPNDWADRFADALEHVAKLDSYLESQRIASKQLQSRADELEEQLSSLRKALTDEKASVSPMDAPNNGDYGNEDRTSSHLDELATLRAEKEAALRETEKVREALAEKSELEAAAVKATENLEDALRIKEKEHEESVSVIATLQSAAGIANERILDLEKKFTPERVPATEETASNGTVSSKQLEGANRRIEDLEQTNQAMSRDLATARENHLKVAAELADISKASSVRTAGDDSMKLEAKVTELERMLAAKNAEIAKVREKARSYLKDMNAEKKEMETRLRASVTAAEQRLATEQAATEEARQETERTVRELDSCLVVIGEKQKSVQALSMAIESEQGATKDAHALAQKTAAEFEAYKERARLALEERDKAVENASAGIDGATADLKEELRTALLESQDLRKALTDAKSEVAKMSDAAERASKAEAALELARSDMSLAFSNSAGRVETLEEDAENLRKKLAASESACSNAESRVSTALVRLEVSERALHAAELAAKENARVADITIKQLREQVLALEKAVFDANASAAAAQRTAAVAARAMAYTSLDGESHATSASQLHESPSVQSELEMASPLPPVPASPAVATSSRAHSYGPYTDSTNLSELGGGSGATWRNSASGDVGWRHSSADDVASRDDQIAVLMSQISELGALLADAREEYACREQQVDLLKSEVRSLESKLAAADKLSDGTPFELLRTTVLHYMRTGDNKLLPVLAQVLGISEEEMMKVREAHASASGVGDTAGYLPSFMRS